LAYILVINPGSTSTKIAVYENEKEKFKVNVEHPAEELAKYKTVPDQYDMRKDAILDRLRENNIDIAELSAIVARGGGLPPIKGGAYRISKAMVERLKHRPALEHASNVAAGIALELAEKLEIPAYIYDGVSVDEMPEIARISGMPELPRDSLCHVLNMRAVARKVAGSWSRNYTDMNVIVAHLGGGITLSVHKKGKMVDILSDDEGPFSPERSGRVSCRNLLDLCYSGKYVTILCARCFEVKVGCSDAWAPATPSKWKLESRMAIQMLSWFMKLWLIKLPKESVNWRQLSKVKWMSLF